MRRSVAVLFLFIPAFAQACSGKDPVALAEGMKAIDRGAHLGAAFCLLVAAVAWRLRLRIALPFCLHLFVIHPAWTMSPFKGDCGTSQLNGTFLFALLVPGVLLWDSLRRKP